MAEGLHRSAETTELLARAVDSSEDLVLVGDANGRLVHFNLAARQVLGIDDLDEDDLAIDRFYGRDALGLREEVVAAIRLRGHWRGEIEMRRADGRRLLTAQVVSGTVDADGRLTGISIVARDITTQKRIQVELAHRATHDWLTGLPNRSLLLNHLDVALARARRHRGSIALLFCDIDRLKRVNDQYGHEAGDELLRTVANRVRRTMRPSDTVARIGGDEFIVLCDDLDAARDARMIAERLIACLEFEPFSIGGAEHKITASIGIAVSDGDDHPEGLLREADAAMYRAKAQGRNRYEIFDEALRSRLTQQRQLSDELADGLESDEIEVYFQPAIDLRTGRVVAIEALARWRHPYRGLLGPDEFIPIVEQAGLITDLGNHVLAFTCKWVKRWHELLGDAAPTADVNVSTRCLATDESIDHKLEIMADAGVDPSWLCFEVTESAVIDDTNGAIGRLMRLRNEGVSVAIDDFGTGYASLQYLHQLPVDTLKIDKSFVEGLDKGPWDEAIIAAVVELAKRLDIQVIAEGIERDEQAMSLLNLGCVVAQGFLFAKAAPAEELLPLLIASARDARQSTATPTVPIQLS